MSYDPGKLFLIIFSLFLMLFTGTSFSNSPPVLRFSDIDSGPSVGLGDGIGEGVIVTLWGQKLGHQQNESSVIFVDSLGKYHYPSVIYYWKNADGKSPGGPADLYESHFMQEIAFSLPKLPEGKGQIKVMVNGLISNGLPFHVKNDSRILWVSSGGDNKHPCTYILPCKFVNGDISGGAKGGVGNNRLKAGDIVYSNDAIEPDLCGGGRCVGFFLRGLKGTHENPISFISYPGSRSFIKSKNAGVVPYKSSYINISKYTISVGGVDPSKPPNAGSPFASNFHIQVANGRYVGNLLIQNDNTCVTGYAGSIYGNGIGVDGVKVYGNQLNKVGCRNTSRFQHTTYLSIRDEKIVVNNGWDFSFNYLKDNYAMFGIHFYDEQINSGDCGKLYGKITVSNNVILNQWGSGINISTRDAVGVKRPCWEPEIIIQNNILINTGLGDELEDRVVPYPNALRIVGDLSPLQVNIINNTFYQWGNENTISEKNNSAVVINMPFVIDANKINFYNNLVAGNYASTFIDTKNAIEIKTNNLFYSSKNKKENLLGILLRKIKSSFKKIDWENSVLSEPRLKVYNSNVSIMSNSPLVDRGTDNILNSSYDIYGNRRVNIDIGAVEAKSYE